MTTDGIQRISMNEDSQLIIPGENSPSTEDLMVGDFVATIVRKDADNLQATQMLVKPDRPVSVHQLTGVIISSDTHQITFIDKSGNMLLLRNLISDFFRPVLCTITLLANGLQTIFRSRAITVSDFLRNRLHVDKTQFICKWYRG